MVCLKTSLTHGKNKKKTKKKRGAFVEDFFPRAAMKTQAVSRASFAEYRLLDVIEPQLASSMVILPYF